MKNWIRTFLIFSVLMFFCFMPTIETAALSIQDDVESLETMTTAYNRTELAKRVVSISKKYLGVPYKLGANYNRDKSYKFDCSSFTQKVFSEVGIKLPRTVLTQLRATKKVSIKNVKIGDLVYFDTDFSGGTNHIGIYLGSGRVIHASTANGGKVQITNVSASKYWRKTVTYVTRVF